MTLRRCQHTRIRTGRDSQRLGVGTITGVDDHQNGSAFLSANACSRSKRCQGNRSSAGAGAYGRRLAESGTGARGNAAEVSDELGRPGHGSERAFADIT